ncbi:MAG: hypothetical protein UX21_C0028G0002 [Microgenomates group bacterium GW2011_GWC2_45_8]|uniref:AAA+ ATPase domain-containing protein n=1 Tax=Candidatus Beckwithbacteria bacterium RIFCSPHIGHO2_12_FULL_47_17 TaxID=1797460 RepID=A0A1F5DKQ2_9BACT|nr:MAG: hypothetical protein UX21_C0028G0002 [Microgenomates group bacterium GW2011_GWC2_45_8]OGD55685.1 MAG: hypothetical protein A3E73_00705 [Candidatus Beckwithbacteria bacterium RIFCSPHIGHO2_12_FULL_47_17]HLD34558.1 AAA family ATPase [Patescibacteria group bacterium]
MLERKIEPELIAWKGDSGRKPLIIRGARQVGKTSLIRKFGKEHYSEVVEINLEKKEQLRIFDPVESVTEMLKRINLVMGKRVKPGKTLLFIDEIQESRNLMELLRFFAEERPDLHVITAGSLLEAKMGTGWTIPVGRVDYLNLYPLTFFEYLQAIGKNELVDELSLIKLGEETPWVDLATGFYREYVLMGGMPEVVAKYAKSPDFEGVKKVFARLINAYENDIGRYAKGRVEKKYLELVMEYAPRLAGGLFKYENFGESGYRSREIGEAVLRLEQVRLLTQVRAINSTSLPLMYKDKRAKKMIWLDVGMVNFVNNAYQEIVSGGYKGKIMEQIVGQTLIAGGTRRPAELGYWARNRDEGSAEVDFCWQYEDRVVGLEVKSGNTREMKSLFSMVDRDLGKVIPVRVSWDKLGTEKYKYSGREYKVLSLPFYLLERWKEFVTPIL